MHIQFNLCKPKLTTESPDKLQPSVDRWLSFGGITTITNERGPGIELCSDKVKWGIIVHRKKGERRKVDNYVVDSRITCTGQKTRRVHIEFFNFFFFFFFFFFLIDKIPDQLLTELRRKMYLDKYSNFASKAAKGYLVL